jgi:hypothetical protein
MQTQREVQADPRSLPNRSRGVYSRYTLLKKRLNALTHSLTNGKLVPEPGKTRVNCAAVQQLRMRSRPAERKSLLFPVLSAYFSEQHAGYSVTQLVIFGLMFAAIE